MRALCMSLCLAVLGSAAACGPAKPAESPSAPSSDGDSSSSSGPSSSGSSSSGGDSDSSSSHASATPTPPPPSSAPSGSGVPYDKEAVEIVLKRAARQVKAHCGAATNDDGKATGPWGKFDVSVKLGHNGHSAGATVPAPYDGKPVGKCVSNAFAILQYPPFAGGDTTVDWSVEIAPPSAAAPAAH